MITFIDGPAKDHRLSLRRCPVFLRAVVNVRDLNLDALDQPDDLPLNCEVIYAYELTEKPGICHIRASGGHGGFHPIASYRLVAEQPDDASMRQPDKWAAWVETRIVSHPRPDLGF